MVRFSCGCISPLQLSSKGVIISSYTGLYSSDPSSSIALKAKIRFHNCLRAPIHGQRQHCTSMPVPSSGYQTRTTSQNIPECWATQLQIPDGCSCKLSMSNASKGAFEGCFILMNDILVLRKKPLYREIQTVLTCGDIFWPVLVTITSTVSSQ